MPVQFAPTPPRPEKKTVPPQGNGPPASAPSNRSKAAATTTTAPSSTPRRRSPSSGVVKEILKTVTPNYVVTAVIKNRLEEGKIKAQKKKRKSRSEILAGMDLRELQVVIFVCLSFARDPPHQAPTPPHPTPPSPFPFPNNNAFFVDYTLSTKVGITCFCMMNRTTCMPKLGKRDVIVCE